SWAYSCPLPPPIPAGDAPHPFLITPALPISTTPLAGRSGEKTLTRRIFTPRSIYCTMALFLLLFAASVAEAQTTAFSYQGKLTDNGNLANASYDMQFKLFDAATNGNQIGTTLTFDGVAPNPAAVAVSNGSFAVNLDFGACPTCFNGNSRFLEIAVR